MAFFLYSKSQGYYLSYFVNGGMRISWKSFWRSFFHFFFWLACFGGQCQRDTVSHTTCTTKVGQIRRQHERSCQRQLAVLSFRNSFVAYFFIQAAAAFRTHTKFYDEGESIPITYQDQNQQLVKISFYQLQCFFL